MKTVRTALVVLACTLPMLASAQWQWVDKSGRKVFSDQAPPADIAPNRILKSPGGRHTTAMPEAAPTETATATAPSKSTGKDPALEKKRAEAEAAEAAKKKAEEQKHAAVRSENCSRAKAGKATYDSGIRVAHLNAKGEREFVDDGQRATEMRRLEEVIARDCK